MNISGKCTFSFHGYLCSQKCIFYTFQSTWEPINLCFTSFTLCLQCAHDLAPDYGCVSAFFCCCFLKQILHLHCLLRPLGNK